MLIPYALYVTLWHRTPKIKHLPPGNATAAALYEALRKSGAEHVNTPQFRALLKNPAADRYFLKGLSSRNISLGGVCATGLAILKTPRSIPLLAAALRTTNFMRRGNVVIVLAAYHTRPCTTILLRLLKSETNANVATCAFHGFIGVRDPRITSTLIHIARTNPILREPALATLAARQSARCLRIDRAVLQSFGTPKADKDELMHALRHDHRKQVVTLLRNLGRHKRSHPRPPVRKRTLKAGKTPGAFRRGRRRAFRRYLLAPYPVFEVFGSNLWRHHRYKSSAITEVELYNSGPVIKTLPPGNPKTAQLYNTFLRREARLQGYGTVQNPAFLHLLNASDADRYFLEGFSNARPDINSLCATGLATLKTGRSFRALAAALPTANMFQRWSIITTLAAFHQRRCVGVLLHEIQTESNRHVTAGAFGGFVGVHDPRITPALVDIVRNCPQLRAPALEALAQRQSTLCLREDKAVLQSRTVSFYAEETLVRALATDHRKAVVSLLADLLPTKPGGSWAFSHETVSNWVVREAVRQYFMAVRPHVYPLGGFAATYARRIFPRSAHQCYVWWKENRHRFNNHMQPVHPVGPSLRNVPEPRFPIKSYGKDAEKLVLRVRLNKNVFRPGSSIELNVTFRNLSRKPYFVVFPHLSSGWWPMGCGFVIKDITTGKIVLRLEPSAMYIGSYAGPPPFHSLPPGRAYRQSIALQHVIARRRGVFPLKPGMYKFTLIFDSRKFAGIVAKPPAILGTWTAPPVTFRVR